MFIQWQSTLKFLLFFFTECPLSLLRKNFIESADVIDFWNIMDIIIILFLQWHAKVWAEFLFMWTVLQVEDEIISKRFFKGLHITIVLFLTKFPAF